MRAAHSKPQALCSNGKSEHTRDPCPTSTIYFCKKQIVQNRIFSFWVLSYFRDETSFGDTRIALFIIQQTHYCWSGRVCVWTSLDLVDFAALSCAGVVTDSIVSLGNRCMDQPCLLPRRGMKRHEALEMPLSNVQRGGAESLKLYFL